MRGKTWKKIAAVALAAAILIPFGIGGYTTEMDGIYIDGTASVSGNRLTGPQGSALFNQWVEGESAATVNGSEILIKTTKMGWWKSFFQPQPSGGVFPMSGKGVLKLELKYSHEVEDEALADQITVNTMLRVVAGGQQTFVQDIVKDTAPVPGVERTDTYYIDAASGMVVCMVNDEYKKSVNIAGVQTDNISELRFYVVTKPKGSSVEDGVTPLSTPLTWHIDHFSAQKMDYADALVEGMEDGAENVSVNQEFTLKFDVPMDASTLNSDTILLEAETADGFEPVAATVTAVGNDVTSCTVKATEPMNYTSNYRISLTEGVKSSKLSLSAKAGIVTNFRTEARNLTEIITYQNEAMPVRLTVNGVSSNTLKAGNVVCTVDLTSAETKSAHVITALYEKGENGGMRYISSSEKIRSISGNTSVECDTVTVPEDSGYVLRIMIWDEAGYPWSDAVECVLGQEPAFVK